MDRQPGAPSRLGQLSPDRQFVWDGAAWRPVLGWRWDPTAWTHPLQFAAGGFLIVQALVGAVLVLTERDQLRAAVLAQIQRQMAGQPNAPDPAQLAQIADLSVNLALGASVVVAVIGLVLGILTMLRRWSWLFYLDLVIFGLGAVGIYQNIANATNGYPAALWIPSLLFSFVSLALFVVLLVARLSRGVWGARRAPVA